MNKGARTKQLLYNCAIALFKEKGYQNVSVDEIVRKAGTAKGTFYIYFQSKSSIIGEMMRQYDAYYDSLCEEMSVLHSVEKKLDFLISRSCIFTEKEIGLDLIRVLYENQLQMRPDEQEAMDINRTLYQVIIHLIQEGQEKGLYRADQDCIYLAELLIRCLRDTFYEWCMKAGGFNLEQECLEVTRRLRSSF